MNTRTKEHTILVVGGAGYIGAHMVKHLKDSGYFPLVLDDLSTGTKEAISENADFFLGDMGDKELIKKIHKQHPFSVVMHFAAHAQTNESAENPLEYYENNISKPISLLKVLHELEVNHFVFSSSAAVYGNPQNGKPINEKHATAPVDPDGDSKLMIEKILKRVSLKNKLNVVCLRYFNVAGVDPEINFGKRQAPPTNLISTALQSIITEEKPTIPTFDGACVRDYIDVRDLCSAHLKAMKFLLLMSGPEKSVGQHFVFNLGTGIEYSVNEVIKIVQEVTKKQLTVTVDQRRFDSPEFLVVSGKLAQKALEWRCKFSLKDTIKSAWESELLRARQQKAKQEILFDLGMFSESFRSEKRESKIEGKIEKRDISNDTKSTNNTLRLGNSGSNLS